MDLSHQKLGLKGQNRRIQVLQQLEGNLIQPVVMRRAVHLKPALLILWQFVMGAAFGVPGLVIATPVLAVVKVGVELFYVQRTLHKELAR